MTPVRSNSLFFRLKRAVYEWGAITLAALSTALLGCWVVTIARPGIDIPAVCIGRAFVSVAHGSLSFSDQLGETPQSMDAYILSPSTLRPRSDRRIRLPGFYYRSIRDESNSPTWLLSFSTLIPFVVTALLATICFYRHRAMCRRPASVARHASA
jgi:hypothetical protein